MGQATACERERDRQRENGAYLNEAMQRSLVGDGVGSIPASAAAQSTVPERQKRHHFPSSSQQATRFLDYPMEHGTFHITFHISARLYKREKEL